MPPPARAVPPPRPTVPPHRPPPPPPRHTAGDALVALVAGRRRTTGCAWERSARRHIVHHPVPPPPLAWHNLNAAVAAGTTPASAFRATLGPAEPIPATHSRDGLLTPRDQGRRFVDDALARYVASVFVAAAIGRRRSRQDSVFCPPPVRLHHHDLFHGHCVYAASVGFALLLHAAEYPAFSEGCSDAGDAFSEGCSDAANDPLAPPTYFPYHLGRGQAGSTLVATPARLAWRNILAAGGRLASVDAGPASPIHAALVWPELAPVGTLCESDLGVWVGDVVYVRGQVWGFEGPG